MAKADASNLAAVYSAAGKEAGNYRTNVEFRQTIIDRVKALGLQGKYPGAADAHDKSLMALFGDDATAAIDRVSAAAKMDTLAWKVWGIGR